MTTSEVRSPTLLTAVANPCSDSDTRWVALTGNHLVSLPGGQLVANSGISALGYRVLVEEIFPKLPESRLSDFRVTSRIFRGLSTDVDACDFLLRNQLKGKICSSDFAKLEKHKRITGKDFESDEIIELNLDGSKITDGQLEALIKRFPNLQSLNLHNCRQITNAGLTHLRDLTNLESLDLRGCYQITDEGLAHLRALTNLQSLNLGGCEEITDEGLAHLRTLINLRSLDLTDCRQITAAGLVHLTALRNLQSLNLRGCTRITDAGLAHLRDLTNLQSLDLTEFWEITDAGLAHLTVLRNLQSLNLGRCMQITNAGLDHLRALENLQSLDLFRCRQITDAGLAPFLERGIQITR